MTVITDMYVRERLSEAKIAKHLGIKRGQVAKALDDAGIKRRTRIEAAQIARPKHVVSPSNRTALIEIVDGLMLGDGNLLKGGELSLGQSIVRKEWVEGVHADLERLGVSSLVRDRKKTSKTSVIRGKTVYSGPRCDLRTLTYDLFFEQRQRWYCDRVKIIPLDIVLTPVSVAHWFSGDGSAWANGGLCFSTHCFTYDECELLKSRLKLDLDVHSNLINPVSDKPHQWAVHVGQRDEAVKLRNAITAYVPTCCQYKFDGVRQRIYSKIDWDQVKDLGVRKDEDIAEAYGVAVTTVASARQARGIDSFKARNKGH